MEVTMLRFKDGTDGVEVLDHAFLVLPYEHGMAYVYEFREGQLIAKHIPVLKHDVPRLIGCDANRVISLKNEAYQRKGDET
jgi:hypothetical protein